MGVHHEQPPGDCEDRFDRLVLDGWGEAEGRYARGGEPRPGAVLAFRPTRVMPLGHVAVVSEIMDERRVLLDHANWSGPGMIERRALAVDVSAEGDWSAVRVWYAPIGTLGARENPTFGFIYSQAPEYHLAARDREGGGAGGGR